MGDFGEAIFMVDRHVNTVSVTGGTRCDVLLHGRVIQGIVPIPSLMDACALVLIGT